MSAVRHLTAEKLAERLGVSESTLKDWRYKGTGPRWLPVGRHVRYRECDVEAWERSLLTPASR